MRVFAAIAIGVLATFALFTVHFFALGAHDPILNSAIFWQEPLLLNLPAWHAIVSPQSPVFGSLTLMASFILGFTVHGSRCYCLCMAAETCA